MEILDNRYDNIENSEILPMWFLEYLLEKPIGLIFEEFENDNAEEIESMKADLNIDQKINIFDYKKLSGKYELFASSYSNSNSNAYNSYNNKQYLNEQSRRIERTVSAPNLIANLNNSDSLNNKIIISENRDAISIKDESDNLNEQLNENIIFELNNEKEESIKDKAKNSENSSIKTSDSNSIRNTPANSNINIFDNFENNKNELFVFNDKTSDCQMEIIEKEDNKENEELKIENLENLINEGINENHDSIVDYDLAEQSQRDPLLKKILSKYSFINFNFRNTNFLQNYNKYSNANNYKNYINSTHFHNGYDLRLDDKENQLQQKNIINKNNKVLAKGFNNKNSLIKPAIINEQKLEEINKSVSLSNLGKSSFNRAEIMNNLLNKNYPNDIYTIKKISIVENLNLNCHYFFLRYKNFDLIRFSMETDLLIVPEEHSAKYLEALNNSDDVIFIYFDDITKDFYGFSKLKCLIENDEVEEYLQENYDEVLDIFQSQYQSNGYDKSKKKLFSFLQIEWLWKTKLSFDKVEILKNALKNYELFVDSDDGQEIAFELGFYVTRLMIKRLTKDEVQEYLNTKKQLEAEKLLTPLKNKVNVLTTPDVNERTEGIDSKNNCEALHSNNFINSFLNDGLYNENNLMHFANNFPHQDNKAFQQFRNNFNKFYNMNMNNKGSMAAMNNMNKMFFNQFMNGGFQIQGNGESVNNNFNNQFQKNFQNFYAANNMFNNNQDSFKQSYNNYINENSKEFSKNNPRINSNTNNIKKYLNIDDSKSINVDHTSINSFKSINIEKMNINSTNNLMEKFSNVSNCNQINFPEEIKNNFENILLEKIKNNYHYIPNLNNIQSRNSIDDSNKNNNIIVTNISNLQVNISQNSYNTVESENRNHKDKSKKQTSKDKKHRKSLSRSRSRSKNKSYQNRKNDERDSKDKKKKYKRNSSRDRRKSFEKDKYFKDSQDSISKSSFIENDKIFKNKLNEKDKEIKTDNRSDSNGFDINSKKINQIQQIKIESNKSFDLFDKDDELNIDKLIEDTKSLRNKEESYE